MTDQDKLRAGVEKFFSSHPKVSAAELVAYIHQHHTFCGIECPQERVVVVRFCCAFEPEIRFDLTKPAGPT